MNESLLLIFYFSWISHAECNLIFWLYIFNFDLFPHQWCPYSSFKPTRGSGWTISPLSLLGYYWITFQTLGEIHSQGIFSGIRVTKKALVISYLLFTNDILIFSRMLLIWPAQWMRLSFSLLFHDRWLTFQSH